MKLASPARNWPRDLFISEQQGYPLCKRSSSLGEIIKSKHREATKQRLPAIHSGHSSKPLKGLNQLSFDTETKSGTSGLFTLCQPSGLLFVTPDKRWLLTRWIYVTPRGKSIRAQGQRVSVCLPPPKSTSAPGRGCCGPGCNPKHLADVACF